MDKKEIKRDVIRDRMLNILTALTDNPKKFMTYIVGISICLLIIIIYSNNQANNLNRQNVESSINQNKYIDGSKDLALSGFSKMLQEYSSSESYNQAFIYAINDAIENNDLEQIENLIDNNKFKTKDNTLKSLVYNLFANYYLKINNNDKAIEYYMKAIDTSDITNHIFRFKLNLLYLYYELGNFQEYENLLSNVNIEDINSYQLKSKYEELNSRLN